jgi:hypothetical protein
MIISIDMQASLYYHGSSSASLVGVLSEDSPGLKCLGRLLELGQVPYTGELSSGFTSIAASSKAISVVPIHTIGVAIDFALDHAREGWNPIKGRENMQAYQKYLELNYARNDAGDPDWYYKWRKGCIEGIIQVERIRIEKWPLLSEREKELIGNPFPVIYEIYHKGNTLKIRSGYGLEVGITCDKGLEDLTIYVPLNQVESVRESASVFGHKPQVESFRALEKYRDASMTVERDIEDLIKKTQS